MTRSRIPATDTPPPDTAGPPPSRPAASIDASEPNSLSHHSP